MKKLLTWIFALIVLSSFVFAAADINLTTELWGYWSSDNADLDGSNATDKLNNHNLSITDATTGETGILQECFGYDGTDDYILTSTPDVKKLYDYSLQVWIKCSSGSYPHVGGFGYWVADDFYSHVVGDAGAGVMAYYDAYKINNPTIYSGDVCNSSWVHLLYVVTNSYVAVFVNGELGGNISNTNNWRPKDNNRLDTLLFGGRAKNGVVDEDFSGYIDEMAIWNRTLNYTEAYSLWNGGSGLPYSNFLTTPTTIEFTAQDSVNSSSINDFAINISWVNGTMQEESTSTGTIIISDTIESDTTINVTFWNVTGYMDKTMLNQAINANTTNSITGLMDFIQTTRLYFGISDQWNGSLINDFAVNISWLNGSVETSSTSNGTASMEPEVFANTTVNITFWNMSGYYSQSITDQLLVSNISNVINSTTYQAVACFNATEIISGYWITADNYTIGSNSTTECFNISAGTHAVIAEKAGYYNLTGSITVPALSNTSYNIEGFYNTIIDFTAYNAISNATVSDFTIDIDFGESISTTNGTVFINALNNTNYTFNITSPGSFTSRYNLTFNTTGATYNVNTSLYTFNSIQFNIFNESSLAAVTQLVTVHTISNLTSFSNTTSTGFIEISLLQPNSHEIRFESAGFNPRSLFLTVTNDSSQNITVYLTENKSTELQKVEVLDTANQPVEGAIVWIQKELINESEQWITIQEAQTDYNGETTVWVERDVTIFYRFAVIYEGEARPIQPSGNLFTGKTSFIPEIDETIQLIIDLEEDPVDFISDNLAISFDCNMTNTTAICTIIDGRNSITGAELRLEAAYINESLSWESIMNDSFTGSSGSLQVNLTTINNSVWRARAYILYEDIENLIWEDEYRLDIDVIVEKNTGLFYAVLILAVVFGLTVMWGPLPSGIVGVCSLIPLIAIKIISLPIGVITGLLALVVIFFFRTRKNDTE